MYRSFVFSAVICVLVFVGCANDGKYPVSGTVTWEGSPVPADHNGHITFMPIDTSVTPDACAIGPDGKYTLRASPGEKRVEILISRPSGKKVEAMGMAPQEMYVPRKYNEESKLLIDVKAEKNEFDFELEP